MEPDEFIVCNDKAHDTGKLFANNPDFIARGGSHVQSEVETRSPLFFLAFPEAFELRPGSFP